MMSCAVLGDRKIVEKKADQAFPPTHREYENGDWLWIRDDRDAWLPAKVVDGDHRDRSPDNHVDVEVMSTLHKLSASGVRRLTGSANQGAREMLASTGVHIVDNLVNLEQVIEPVIIHQLRERFYAGRPVHPDHRSHQTRMHLLII